jgi:hypothetical protein
MLEHRMIGEADLAGDVDRPRLGQDALELNALAGDDLDAVEPAEEIVVPPRAAELAVGGKLSWASVISPFSCLARASLIGAVRKKLPTWSARKGGLVRCMNASLLCLLVGI